MTRDFKGVWIPKELLKRYKIVDALLISAYKMNAPGLSKYQIRRVIKMIGKTNYSINQIKDIVIMKIGQLECSWCGDNCHILEEHHYPISRSEGGKETVNICGKCHSDFHKIESNNQIK